MRAFTAGSGFDSTAAVQAYLASHDQLDLADLYLIGEVEDPNAVWLTNWESPLSWPVYGTFLNAVIKRGKITSQFGLKVDSLPVTWSPPLTAFGSTSATANPYQRSQLGFYDNWKVRIWRCLMPTPGDANTFGACEFYGGWVGGTEIGRGYIKFSIDSFLSVLTQKVPANVIESSNALASYVGAQPAYSEGETNVPQFTVVAPSSETNILGQCTYPTANHVYDEGVFINGYMFFNPGSTLAGYYSPIALNQSFQIVSGGPHYNEFQVFAEFPWPPSPGDTFYVSTQLPGDLASAPAGMFQGFPYVPDPTQAL